MATQLEQFLAYLDRPGVSEVTFCVGKPITLRTNKGVLNVTSRALGSEQLAQLVRGTPLEALIADESFASEPMQIELAERDVTIEIARESDAPTVRIIRIPDKQKPAARGRNLRPRAKSSDRPPPRPEPDKPAPPRPPSVPPGLTTPMRPPSTPPARVIMPSGPAKLVAQPAGAPAEPAAPRTSNTPSTPPHTLQALPLPILPARPAPPPPGEPSEPAPAPDDGGPPPLDLVELARAETYEVDAVDKLAKLGIAPLRIDVRQPHNALEPSDQSGIIALDRAPGMPLSAAERSLEALGLPADLATTVARERGLVLICAPHGHGKTSTLAALFDRIDRALVPHVVTIDTLRDRDSIDLALTTAESGYFVLATLTASSPTAAIDSLLDSYPGMTHGRVKTRLAAVLVAVIAKHLPPTPSQILTAEALRTLL